MKESLSLDARTSNLSGQSGWWRFVECGVESQPGDESDRLCQRLAEVEQFEGGVAAVCHHGCVCWVASDAVGVSSGAPSR